jgi:hypothetical protein
MCDSIKEGVAFRLQQMVVCLAITAVILAYPLDGRTGELERIGLVKTVQTSATILRQGKESALQKDAEIYEGDSIFTDSDGSVGITFNDGSMLTLGSSAEVKIDTYLFNLREHKFSFLTEVLKGTVVFISGAINKLAPGSIRLKTPTATLGMRGTKVIVDVD